MIIYFIANTLSRLLVRVYSQKTQLKPYAASAMITVSSYIGMTTFGLATAEKSIFIGLSPIVIFVMVGNGIMATFFGKLSIKAQKHIDTANYMIIRQISVPTAVLLGTFALNEGLHFVQILGMIVILVGSYFVGTGGSKIKIRQFGYYELQVLAYGAFLGLYSISSRFIEQQTSLSSLLVLGGICEVAPSLHMAKKEVKSVFSKSDYFYIALIGLFTTIHVVSFWLATKIADNISIVSTLGTLRIIPIFVASYLLLKERNDLRLKLIGCFISIIGLLLL